MDIKTYPVCVICWKPWILEPKTERWIWKRNCKHINGGIVIKDVDQEEPSQE